MVKFAITQIGEVLERLHHSEIDFRITSVWPNVGFDMGGDSIGTARTEIGSNISAIRETVNQIAFEAAKKYDESDFAKWYKEFPDSENNTAS